MIQICLFDHSIQKFSLTLIIEMLNFLAYGQYSVAERAEHLRQWLEANRNSFPQPITDDLISSISGNNDIATTILKIFGFSSEPKVLETQFTKTTNLPSTSRNGIKVADRQVCPFDADPLILSGEYSYCKPTSIGECPAGFVCDFSLVLGRSICCQDMRNQPIINIRIKSQINSTSNPLSTTLSSRREKARIHENTWSSTVPNRRSPWYIRDRRPLYRIPWIGTAHSLVTSRATIAPTTLISKNRELATTESAIIEIDSNEVTAKGFISTTSKIASVTDQQGISHQSKSEIGPVSRKLSQTTMPAPFVPSVSTDHLTSVSLIQVGNVERVTDKRMLIVGTIALINDQGYRILRVSRLSKEMISMDEIAVIVITSGHPSHTGNLNLFPLKPTLFHTMEFTEQHATISELKDRPYRKLTENVEVWKTPGPTQQSLSVLVYNVEGYGTMAIVGDLIPSEDYVFNRTDSSADFDGSVWDSLIRRQNSNLIICLADWIVPGHGQPFKVLPLYRYHLYTNFLTE
uniref:Lactamase_B domain-containing protein n=1 Tax=Elaeophora elaphi TaxID=1147741 RepID=A0A0R3RFF5_9BILA